MNSRFYIRTIYSLILLFAVNSEILSQTVTVKQDGSGDYTKIQEAVDAVDNGDTVLVWPGEYFENVIIQDKYLTLASLFLTTNDETYIDSTIINGNQTGSGIAILDEQDTSNIIGFSITNGSGHPVYPDIIVGGGVSLYESYAIINSCKIFNNNAHEGGGGISLWRGHCIIENSRIIENFSPLAGGGISCGFESYIVLSGTDIINNYAYYNGGGMVFVESEATFDSVNRCTIYLNFSGAGCDVSRHNSSTISKIYADTLSVISLDNYFFSSYDDFGYPLNDIEIDAFAAKIDPHDGDLYVNPQTGNDNYSGTQPDSALKTIAIANAKIKVDSLHKNTIHLANGLYSDSANSEKFPINLRPYIDIIGTGREESILDGMFESYLVKGNTTVSEYRIANLTMQKGTMVDYENLFNNTYLFGFVYYDNDNVTFDSIKFTTGIGIPGRAGLEINGVKNIRFSNCIFENIKGLEALDITLFHGDTAFIQNCIFNQNKPDTNNPEWIYGKALRIHGGYSPTDPFIAVIQNCLFSNNDENAFLTSDGLVYLINNTFVNNSLESFDVSAINNWASRGHMYNCISSNNGESPFGIWQLDGIPAEFNVYHSCIEGGEMSFTVGPNSTLNYGPSNIDADPLFLNIPEYPYNLSSASPCIDAGTLEIPEWIELYPYDLAGNPRIYGQGIDMGAYEWNPTVGLMEPAIISQNDKVLSAAPNPFSDIANIMVDVDIKANMYIDIYNSIGGHIRHFNLITQAYSTGQIQWDGRDKSGGTCPAGTYIVVLRSENLLIDELKLVKMK